MRSLIEKRRAFSTAARLLAAAGPRVEILAIVPRSLAAACLIAALTFSTCLAQSGVLENYATMRSGVNGPLWLGETNATAGDVTVCSLGVNQMICAPQPQGVGPVLNGVGVMLMTLDETSEGPGYADPGSYVKAYIRSGTWQPTVNRLNWQYYCDGNIPGSSLDSGTHANVEIGTYVRNVNDPNPAESGQGQHYYHDLYSAAYAGQMVYAQINMLPNHEVGASGNEQPPMDPEWFMPTQSPGYTAHYFDRSE